MARWPPETRVPDSSFRSSPRPDFASHARYVEFGAAQARALVAAAPRIAPHFGRVTERFYAQIRLDPDALAVFQDEEQVERQRLTLSEWLARFFDGPHDDGYHALRSRIGQVHVEVGLAPRYMALGMELIRSELNAIAQEVIDPGEAMATCAAIDRLCAVELAIMLEAYHAAWSDRLQRKERLATVGQLSASISHEIKNPLGVIASSAYVLREHCQQLENRLPEGLGKPVHRHLDRIQRHVEHAATIVTTLLDFVRTGTPNRRPSSLAQVVAQAISMITVPDGIDVRYLKAEGPRADAIDRAMLDPLQIGRVVENLVRNAIEALDGRGVVTVSVGGTEDEVWVCVTDDGPGFDPEVLLRLFEPLTTSKATGTGLGLALCRTLVEAHQGVIEVHRLDPGASIRVRLPRAQAAERR